ncbi:hypothetical protein [Desulforamulus hydrothermalis]|uniref:Uncharacterized protein n=1 Tax=Desulforamulus hydrothermalis Lam5 = DSM 18033 TaxID=1121428 RepID=K8EDY7_9FIRM|nr:hypothetical protein [Desulforamulus hydrothermalis]CCO07016.1 hypothetical protein DESHY_10176 [Desulforamulus hydrothermalis Lam5 = DSM 18033]SHG97524.1 hypothetical protein SAMN02745177_00962 [Desulforamulus hydrothermalis Lam5 = DSM 18033]
MQALLEQISKDREKFIAFLQYLIDTGRLTEDEVISIIRQCRLSVKENVQEDN